MKKQLLINKNNIKYPNISSLPIAVINSNTVEKKIYKRPIIFKDIKIKYGFPILLRFKMFFYDLTDKPRILHLKFSNFNLLISGTRGTLTSDGNIFIRKS